MIVSRRILRPHLDDPRQRMIDETSRFLTWALTHNVSLPRIPIRSVSEGGFGKLMAQPRVETALGRWWARTLEKVTGLD